MRRRSPLLAVLALTAAASGLVVATAPAQAVGPQDIVLPVVGGHEYHHFAAATFSRVFLDEDLPAGVSITGTLTCGATQNGTPIDNNLPGGKYKIDPTTCSGLALAGPNAADYQIKYVDVGSSEYYVRPGQLDAVKDVSATGTLTSLLQLKTTYSGRLIDFFTKQPVAGLKVNIVSQLTILPILNGPKCTAVTDANGRYSCTTPPLSWGLLGQPYLVHAEGNLNYLGTGQEQIQPQG